MTSEASRKQAPSGMDISLKMHQIAELLKNRVES